jgi:NAD(P)-dependent dehydrogenase (short-subunit alcohol dehydrogenase family)
VSVAQKGVVIIGASQGLGAALGKLHPVGRMGEIGDIVDAVLYLETAGFVTGEILHVDGGQSVGH